MNLEACFTFNRKISSRLSLFFLKTPLTPNHITTLSLSAGFFSGYCMSRGSLFSMLAGAFFLQLSFILDNCDGDVARMKSLQSVTGMWYDFIADLGVDLALWSGLALGAARQGGPETMLVAAWTVACGGSLVNFFRVTGERRRGVSGKDSLSGRANQAVATVYALTHDGDPTVFVWVMAASGSCAAFLAAGAAYVNLVWIFGLCFNEKVIYGRPGAR